MVFGSSDKADVEDKLYSLPSYLEALANIIRQLDQVSFHICFS